MRKINFTDKNGTFTITNPENYSGLYLPLAGEEGLKSSITPTLGEIVKRIRIISFSNLSALKTFTITVAPEISGVG